MKKGTKLTAIIASLLCVVLIAGCGGGGNKAVIKSDMPLSDVNEFPIVEEPVTLSMFAVKNPYIEDFATNDFTKFYEEKTNVHIEWNVATGDTTQAFNLMLASGEYNDMVMEIGLSKASMLDYAEQGILMDIKPYIDEHGYYIKEMFEEAPAIPNDLTMDGAIYGLPKVTESYRYEYKEKMWVYKPWLEKLGIAMPETTEDFYQMLKAFKEKDPNGNGIADEIPLAARGVKDNHGIEPFIMSAFIPTLSTRVYVDDKDKVQFVAVQPEYREGLRYLNKLYKEGLLYSDTFILDRAQIMSIGENDPVILGAGPGMFPGMFTISNGNSQRYYEYVAIPPLEGPEGVRAAAKAPNTYKGNFMVTTDCQNPDIAIKWVDWFYSAEGKSKSQATVTSGANEKRPAREGELSYNGQQAKWAIDKVENKASDDAGMTHNRSWQNFGVYYSSFEDSFNTCNYNDILDPHHEWYNAYAAHDKYKTEIYLGDLVIPSEDIAEYNDIKTALNDVEVSFASFVIGDLSLDNDWDTYVANLEKLGLSRYLEILQNAYDASKN